MTVLLAGALLGAVAVTVFGNGQDLSAAGNVSDASNRVTLTTSVTSGDGSDENGNGAGDNGTYQSAWNSTKSYLPGDVVSFAGHKFKATHYSTGAEPNNPASWAVWDDAGTCG
ncbi:carbohydrate-binding protein [Streptomyces ureilyticus]|uniref:Chitin-binding type-3 domain-containing protein n=1 Tax=Streptomyces ureilyticus TaxID=1775131 RepID=A0ABX0E271_9ACTN|nr:carbohydrate-binding protein [Streptomyces ureilyticus]NGO47324.1 hypothetical protein [Streptomyces ureilyticus]